MQGRGPRFTKIERMVRYSPAKIARYLEEQTRNRHRRNKKAPGEGKVRRKRHTEVSAESVASLTQELATVRSVSSLSNQAHRKRRPMFAKVGLTLGKARPFPSHGRGRRFDPYGPHHERPSFRGLFGGSCQSPKQKFAGCSQQNASFFLPS